MQDLHLTDEQISILVDGQLSPTQRALLHEHMAACEGCYSAYRDCLVYRGIWETDASVFRAADDLIATAKRTARGGHEVTPGPSPHRPSTWRSWAPALGMTALAAVIVMVAAGVFRSYDHERASQSYNRVIQPIQNAVVDASTGGSILIPGAEAAAATTASMYRTGQVAADAVLVTALNQLTELYQQNNSGPEVAHWLISGFLATGQLETARLYVQDARLRFPSDSRFLILDGLVSYRLSDITRAERLLQAALQADPNNPTALVNLGLVQYEQGQLDSARRTFEAVRAQNPNSPLGSRAGSLLTDLLNS